MVFMDEYEMPSIFERCDRNLPVHVQFKDETGEKEIDFRFAFVGFIDALFRRVTFGPRRRVIPTHGCMLRVSSFSLPAFFPRLHELTPRFYAMNCVLECGIIATLVISNLFLISRRVPFVNSSRKQKSFLPREIFQYVHVWWIEYKISR